MKKNAVTSRAHSEHGDHPNAVRVVDEDGRLTEEGLSTMLDASSKQREAMSDQALRQTMWGIREKTQ